MKESRIYLVQAPGLEKVGCRDLMRQWPRACELLGLEGQDMPAVDILRGGLEFSAPQEVAYALNFFCKVPSRILLRLGTFPCKSDEELVQILDGFSWEQWFRGQNLEFRIFVRSSRMNHQRRIEGLCRTWWKKNQNSVANSGQETLRLDLRFFRDYLTISLDTTGELLHRRSWRKFTSEAPLRENLAAALLDISCKGLAESYRRNMSLIDPMMGSGTFLVEALLAGYGNGDRKFAFQSFANCPEVLRKPSPSCLKGEGLFGEYWGSDRNRDCLDIIEKNGFLDGRGLASRWQLHQWDFLAEPPPCPLPQGGVVILNPPYGERLSGHRGEGISQWLLRIDELFAPQRCGIVFPGSWKIPWKSLPPHWFLLHRLGFQNGGLDVQFCLFYRREKLF